MKYILSDFIETQNNKTYHGCMPRCFEAVLYQFGIQGLNSTLIEGLSGCYNLCYTRKDDPWEKETVDFEIYPKNNYLNVMNNLGIKTTIETSKDQSLQWSKVKALLKQGYPVLIYTNPYFIEYCDDYLINPGGFFHLHHILVCLGYDEEEGLVYVFDPAIDNYKGTLSLDNFIKAWSYKEGIINPQDHPLMYLDPSTWTGDSQETLWKFVIQIQQLAFEGKSLEKNSEVSLYFGVPLIERLLIDLEESFIYRSKKLTNESFFWSIYYSKKKLKDIIDLGLKYDFQIEKAANLIDQLIQCWDLIVMAGTKAHITGQTDIWMQTIKLIQETIDLEKELNQLFLTSSF